MNETIYIILAWSCPVLLVIVGWFVREAWVEFKALRATVTENLREGTKRDERHTALAERVTKIERKLKWA